MNKVVCFCGMQFDFIGDDGICPRCGVLSSINPMPPDECEKMKQEWETWLASLPDYEGS